MRSLLALLIAAGTTASGCAARTIATSTPGGHTAEVVHERAVPPDPAQASASTDAAEPSDGVVHIVQPGQTLWRIARAYDIELNKLAEANGIADPARVEVGTPIFVPGARATLEVSAYPAPPPSPHRRDALPPLPSADFLWPVDGGAFMRPFGEPRRHHTHAGVDIRGVLGQDIRAARDGVVAFGGRTQTGYGTMVVLDHGDGVQTIYAHAQKVLVRQGDAVRRGQPIALLGRTGNATTEHCHFEIRLENRAVDPMPYLLGSTEAHR
jgi:lipoprotein NlpD